MSSRWHTARLTRRQFVQGAAAASSALLFARVTRLARALDVPPPLGFLSEAELRVVDAMTARLVPSGATAGARDAGVADYIQALLSVLPGADANSDGRVSAADLTAVITALGMDGGPADVDGSGAVDTTDVAIVERAIFAGSSDAPAFAGRPLFGRGPFSGRNPFPDAATGTPSDVFPANQFLEPVPLPRVKRLAWTVRLLGAAAVPEVSGNPLATTLDDVNLRERYREGIAALQTLSRNGFGGDFDALSESDQDAALTQLKRSNASFYSLVQNHTIEGMLCAPEYGGNRDLVGWQLTRFDGDSQPLGYTIFDTTIGDYRERPDKPNSTLDPDDDCAGFSDAMAAFLRFVLVRLAGAQEFSETPCFRG